MNAFTEAYKIANEILKKDNSIRTAEALTIANGVILNQILSETFQINQKDKKFGRLELLLKEIKGL